MPAIEWQAVEGDGQLELGLKSNPPAKKTRFWVSVSSDRDFRDSSWMVVKEVTNTGVARHQVRSLAMSNVAVFAEFVYEAAGVEFSLCSQVFVIGEKR